MTLLALCAPLTSCLLQAPSPDAQQPEPQQPLRTGRATRGDEAPTQRSDTAPEQTATAALGDAPVTSEWRQLREALWQRGVRVTLASLTDASWLAAGGVDPGATALRSLVDVELDLDGERLLSWSGARLYCDLQLQRGEDGSRETGDTQVYSNLDGPDRSQVAQVFFEQLLLDGALRAKVGKFDTNTDLAYGDAVAASQAGPAVPARPRRSRRRRRRVGGDAASGGRVLSDQPSSARRNDGGIGARNRSASPVTGCGSSSCSACSRNTPRPRSFCAP